LPALDPVRLAKRKPQLLGEEENRASVRVIRGNDTGSVDGLNANDHYGKIFSGNSEVHFAVRTAAERQARLFTSRAKYSAPRLLLCSTAYYLPQNRV
jgi:hypothetical protein